MKADKGYIERMKHFLENHCAGRIYDTCTVCQYRMSWGCSHPEHPMNQKVPAVAKPTEGNRA